MASTLGPGDMRTPGLTAAEGMGYEVTQEIFSTAICMLLRRIFSDRLKVARDSNVSCDSVTYQMRRISPRAVKVRAARLAGEGSNSPLRYPERQADRRIARQLRKSRLKEAVGDAYPFQSVALKPPPPSAQLGSLNGSC